ncbi:MAG TPA: hypothetical protein VI391_06495 [Thermoanaerobaculia bacterium]
MKKSGRNEDLAPRKLLFAAAVVVLALATWARVHVINTLPDQGYFAKYTIIADEIRAGHTPRERLLDFSPLYLWFVVALRNTDIRTLQIALVSVAALLVAIAARRFGTLAMFAAPVLLLGSRGALVCATEIEPETLILVLNAGALAALDFNHLAAGFLLGLSATCRPVALLVAVALAIALRSWRLIAAALVPIIVVIIVNFSLTGEITLMDPGTVFYEGMNPSATGYEGVQPRIINDFERQSREPDYLHVAYRIVASQSDGHPLTRAESNSYWTHKALEFARNYPLAAIRLTARKLYFALQSYEAYDLATMARKDLLLSRFPFVPFGLVVALALMAVLLRIRGIAPLLIFAAVAGATLVVFYVTARQRNAMLPPMVILAAAGFAEIVRRRQLVAATMAIAIAVLLSIDGPAQREDEMGWLGGRNEFDEAIALEQHGAWAHADAILAQLEDQRYRPMRENRAVSSIAFYRAVAAAHLGRDPLPLLQQADREAPGNENVLAALAVRGDRAAAQRLVAIHDPLTARRALAAAREQGM